MKLYNEKGQISVLFVIVFTLVLAFTSFAIDGGMMYSQRRHDQNVADSSALAGGAGAAMVMETNEYSYGDFSCSDSLMADLTDGAIAESINFAVYRANINNFADFDDDISDNHGVQVTCFDGDADGDGTVDSPVADKRLEIRVMISDPVQTSFMHIFYKGDVVNVVEAIVEIRPRRPIAFGNAVVALSTDCDNSMTMTGVGSAGPMEIIGGNLVTNGCYNVSGNVEVTVSGPPGDPGIYYVDPDASGTDKWAYSDPYPEQMTETIPTEDVLEPDCSGLPSFPDPNVKKSNPQTIQPGNYPGLTIATGANLYLESGLYCINGDIKIGGKIANKAYDPLDGATYQASDDIDGVTIFLQSGDIDILNSNTEVKLHAPRGLDAVVAPAYRGMIIFSSYSNTSGQIDLSGGSNGFINGTLFAPTSHVDVGGNADFIGNCQIVAYTVTGHGTDKIVVNYTENELFTLPNYVDLTD